MKIKKDVARVHFYTDKETADEIKRVAKRMNISASKMITNVMQEVIRGSKPLLKKKINFDEAYKTLSNEIYNMRKVQEELLKMHTIKGLDDE